MTARFRAVKVVSKKDDPSFPGNIAVLDDDREWIARFTSHGHDDRLEEVIQWMEAGNLNWAWDPVENFEIEEFDQ